MTITELLNDPELSAHVKQFDLHRDHIDALRTIFACEHCQALMATVIKRELVKHGVSESLL